MLAFRTLSFLYLRYVVIILSALCAFWVGFDLLDTGERLPSSANLVVIYTVYKTLYAIDMMLPISLVFAMVASLVELVRSNALSALYAMGYSKMRVLLPFIATATSLTLLHIALHATQFARANEIANSFLKSSDALRPTSDLFFTHEGKYIYFGNLYPLTKKAEKIRIFAFENGTLNEVIRGDEARYVAEHWTINNAQVIEPPADPESVSSGIRVEEKEKVQSLQNFKPKILDQVYEGKANFTIGDGLDALRLLENQNVDVSKIQTALYRIFVTPWYALILIVLLFSYAPLGSRFVNLSLYSFTAILATLLVWGMLLVFGELASNKTLTPSQGVVWPIAALLGVMGWRIGNPLRRVRVKSRKN